MQLQELFVKCYLFTRNLGRCDYCHFDPVLNMSMVEFGGSLTHWVIHVGTELLDIAYRREYKLYRVQGYTDLYKTTKKIVQREIYNAFDGLRVGEVRAGGAGTSE